MSDTVSIPIDRTGWQEIKISIDDYPVEFDNDLYLTSYIEERVDVMNIYESGRNVNVEAAFEGIPYCQLSQVPISNIRGNQRSV